MGNRSPHLFPWIMLYHFFLKKYIRQLIQLTRELFYLQKLKISIEQLKLVLEKFNCKKSVKNAWKKI